MPLIEYRGHTPVVSVPAFRLVDVKAGESIDVPEHVAQDLTLGGTSAVWVRVDETPEG